MQERGFGSKRFDTGDSSEQSGLANIYQEEHTPLQWRGPSSAQRAAQLSQSRPRKRAIRHGLIESQLGLPLQEHDANAEAIAAYSGEHVADDYGAIEPAYAERASEERALRDAPLPRDARLASNERSAARVLTDAERRAASEERALRDAPLPRDARLASNERSAARVQIDARRAYEEYYEAASFYEDFELQEALELDESQPLYDEYAQYYEPHPALDLELPPIAANQYTHYPDDQAHDDAASYEADYSAEHDLLAVQPQPAATGTYPFAQAAQQSAQPSAAKQLTQPAIQRIAVPAQRQDFSQAQVASVRAQPPQFLPNPPVRAATQLRHPVPAQPARVAPARAQARTTPRFVAPAVDWDEAVVYPERRGGAWLKRTLLALSLVGAGLAAHNHFNKAPQPARPTPTPPAPLIAAPGPAPAIAEPAPAPPEPAAAPAANPQESAKARRSAARAALIAERWRERRAARRAHPESSDDIDEEPRAKRTPSSYEAPAAQPAAPGQNGVLRINSRPWSEVHIDGYAVGHTPQMNVVLPAGKHQVSLTNSEMHLHKTLTVHIQPGQTNTQTVNLE